MRPAETQADAYPFNIPAFKNELALNVSQFVTFFVGENGSGKSTLLEAIAIVCGFHAGGGSRSHIYDYRATESALASCLKLVWSTKNNQGFFLRAESLFNFASYLEDLKQELPNEDVYGPYGGESLHNMSHGESFLKLFRHRLRHGIFLLDEPEAALSPIRQLAFLSLMHEMDTSGKSQFIIATHSPILLSYPGAMIYGFTADGIRQTTYEQTEHYTVTKDFLNSPGSFLKHLFHEE